jgi:hypothetical protein
MVKISVHRHILDPVLLRKVGTEQNNLRGLLKKLSVPAEFAAPIFIGGMHADLG